MLVQPPGSCLGVSQGSGEVRNTVARDQGDLASEWSFSCGCGPRFTSRKTCPRSLDLGIAGPKPGEQWPRGPRPRTARRTRRAGEGASVLAAEQNRGAKRRMRMTTRPFAAAEARPIPPERRAGVASLFVPSDYNEDLRGGRSKLPGENAVPRLGYPVRALFIRPIPLPCTVHRLDHIRDVAAPAAGRACRCPP